MILLDVNMPDIDGFETAALIRQVQALGAHADHLRHRVRRRDADDPRLFARRRRLHPVADRPRDPAHEGQGVRRPAPRAAAAPATRRRARRARRGRGGALGRRGEHASVELPVAGGSVAHRIARSRDRREAACWRWWYRSSARARRSRSATKRRILSSSSTATSLPAARVASAVGRQRSWRRPTLQSWRQPSPASPPGSSRARTSCVCRWSRLRRAVGALALWACGDDGSIVPELAERSAGRARERTPLPQPAARDRRAARRRGTAAGVEPSQGRVPGDAVARAAQSPGADPHRGRGDPPGRARRAEAELGDGRHAAPGRPADAPGRRPAGRLADQPGQDRAAARAARPARGRRARGRDRAAVHQGATAPAHEDASPTRR